MSKQPSLFASPKQEGYPIIMIGGWKGFRAYAIVDTPKQRKKLEDEGYIVDIKSEDEDASQDH